MKKISEIINEAKKRLDIQDDTIGFISNAALDDYVDVASRFLSDDAKFIIKWVQDHPKEVHELIKKGGNNNWLAEFYDNGVPSSEDLKDLYKAVGKVVKNNRAMEIPFFQTEEQFNGIVSKEISPDEIILDLNTPSGRNDIAKKYDRLVWKIARSFVGKSNLTLDELYSAGLEGLTLAMNRYGKKTEYNKSDDDKVKTYTFLSFAAYNIKFMILHSIKNDSRIVRIPTSAQQKEKNETGHNTKSNTISGDKAVKGGENGEKTVFDFMSSETGGDNSTAAAVNRADADRIWNDIYRELEKKFNEQTMDIWYSFNELNGHKKMKNKELGQKYGMIPSRVTYYLYIVNSYILKNKKLRELFMDLREIVAEGRAIRDNEKHILDV